MKIFSATQIRDWDSYTIQHEPISSIDLMERASQAFCTWFINHYSTNFSVIVFCGPGNNGGDGLAISRILFHAGFKVETCTIASTNTSPDFMENEKRLLNCFPIHAIHSIEDIPEIRAHIVIDAIFGSGLNRPIEGIAKNIINKINSSEAEIVSVDIASGLYCDSFNDDSTIIKPDYTITFQSPKLSFFLPQNESYVGKLEVLDIGLHEKYENEITAGYSYINDKFIKSIVKNRNKFSHKGSYGTALLITGSYGMMGAAVLSSRACLRTGVGLSVAYVPKCGYEIMQSSIPESMVLTDRDNEKITSIPDLGKYDAIGIGPGLGKAPETKTALHHLLQSAKCPLVLDADALNIIAENKELLSEMPSESILTPHPKEFERLVGASSNDYDRLRKLKDFSIKLNSIVVLKGAYTAIAIPDGRVYFNSTGNPGMATGGSGDVLTGIITSLLAQDYNSVHAALMGVYLHGYAGDVASFKNSESSMIASDIIDNIGEFFKKFSQ